MDLKIAREFIKGAFDGRSGRSEGGRERFFDCGRLRARFVN